jgi:response regulator RpfG family c-di-GMP phosphodiesterase
MLPHNCLKFANSERARFRLLFVGGDVQFLRALRGVLTEPDYHIVSCPHVDSAMDFLKGNPRYNLLMFEFELRGVELTKLARSLAHREHLPIVMLTANKIVDSFRQLSRNARVDEWVSKQDSRQYRR